MWSHRRVSSWNCCVDLVCHHRLLCWAPTHSANRKGTGKVSLSMKYVSLVAAKAREEVCEFVTPLRVTHHDRFGDGLNWIRKREKTTVIPSCPPYPLHCGNNFYWQKRGTRRELLGEFILRHFQNTQVEIPKKQLVKLINISKIWDRGLGLKYHADGGNIVG